MFAYRGVDTGLIRTQWYSRKGDATKAANRFIQKWLNIDMDRDDAKGWIDAWRDEVLELVKEEV